MSNKKRKTVPRKKLYFIIATGATVALAVLLVVSVALSWHRLNQMSMDSLGTSSIRQTLVQSIDAISAPAPRDAKTGDYYFPEAKLMLPVSDDLSHVVYSYDYSESILHATNQQMTAAASSKLYGAQDFKKLFNVLPEYQACKRGMAFSRSPIDNSDYDSLSEAWQKEMPDRSVLYAYTEAKCPAQSISNADIMRTITSY